MSLRSVLRAAFVRGDGCSACGHFRYAPDQVEAAFPGLAALASAHASTWGGSGLCLRHDRVVNGTTRCSAFDDARVMSR